jgi:hypothetical protein
VPEPEPPTGVPVGATEPEEGVPEVAPEVTVPPLPVWALPEVTPAPVVDPGVVPELTMLPLWLSELPLGLVPEENEHALAAKQKMGVRTLNERRSSERTVTISSLQIVTPQDRAFPASRD